MHKKLFVSAGKLLLSAILSFTILTAFCLVYYNAPIHLANEDGSTDYKWASNKFYSLATEGFGYGKTNNEGFLNTFDYDEGMKIDVLVMGSSHMEASQVKTNQSAAARLNSLLKEDTVYNIGVAEHNFLICAQNLSAAIKKYSPQKYVVIETGTVAFSAERLQKTIDGMLDEIRVKTGAVDVLLRKNQYLRLLYMQSKNYLSAHSGADGDEKDKTASETVVLDESNLSLTGDLLEKMSNTAKTSNGARLIIVYHPKVSVGSDASLVLNKDVDSVSKFESLCKENGIIFLDMSERFEHDYSDSHLLPYGFPNTPVGKGHFNKYGHSMVADELYKTIKEVE